MTDAQPALLEVRRLTKRFTGTLALDAVDFDVRAGEVHALLGENGAGKSTLIKVLAGVHPADAGEILLRGRSGQDRLAIKLLENFPADEAGGEILERVREARDSYRDRQALARRLVETLRTRAAAIADETEAAVIGRVLDETTAELSFATLERLATFERLGTDADMPADRAVALGMSSWLLGAAAACLAILFALNRARVTRADLYIVVGLVLWTCVLKSGVHATLAGVATALFIPSDDGRGRSPAEDLEHGLHPWVAFLILPMFAFSNAGVSLLGLHAGDLLHPVSLGIALGLLLGKAVGVFGSSWLMIRFGLAQRPGGADWIQFFGVCVLCGIGFTMSLFIGGLAFAGLGADYETRVKLGVLGGSLLAGTLGTLVLLRARPEPDGAS